MSKHRLKVGDYVCERGDDDRPEKKIGVIVYVMKRAGLVVAVFPPSRTGIAFHPADLVVVSKGRKK